ncbi:DUF3822 family protein [Winogradskyella sp.]|uniref:DUF3822 family protein n=1 Tax=Winogradskyella sp. TaxID=1883156 RepID=UPI0025F28A6A|nr:DUF3822 family protein [Winogradskyella sp.]
MSGLSFCILNRSQKNTIEYLNSIVFAEKLTPFDTLNRLKEELASNTVFSEEFQNINVLHYNELATLVPKSLYNEANNAEYLKFNSKILKTDFIASDELKSRKIFSIYVPYVNINNYIFDTFGSFTFKHSSTVFIDALSIENNNIGEGLFINIENQSMQVITIKNNELSLYNYFEFSTPEDFIYYILFTCEQEQLNPEKLYLKLFGTITKEDDLYAIAYKYIRHVELDDNSNNFLIKNSF